MVCLVQYNTWNGLHVYAIILRHTSVFSHNTNARVCVVVGAQHYTIQAVDSDI